MKICIVTVYNSINSGSFWQAKILGIFLQKKGNEVFYLKRTGGSASKFYKIKTLLKLIIKLKFKEYKHQIQIFKEFNNKQKEFNTINNNKCENIDCFILGSDTIWNIEDQYFEKEYKKYFGGIFNRKKVITYAASIGNTKIDKLKKISDIPEMLKNIKSISVRDESTSNMITELIEIKPKLVCDPTLLINKEEYMQIENRPKDKNYIFLYLFDNLSNKQIEKLKEFAREKNLNIISGTKNFSYCDKWIVNAPYTFLNYMLYADYIITDTFHGTVFSANLNKNFIAINRNKKKVNSFLKMVNLENRLLEEKDNDLKLFDEKILYNEVNEKIEEFRKSSIEYLEEAIK